MKEKSGTNQAGPAADIAQGQCATPRRDARIRPFKLSREIALTCLGIAVTIVATILLAQDILGLAVTRLREASYGKVVEQGIFFVIVAFLIYGNLVYQFARRGYLKRLRDHRPACGEEVDRIFDKPASPLTMLIPSYKEETRVVRQALLSAALQEYPNRRVVLLIDDPPNPQDREDLTGLLAARALPRVLEHLLGPQASKMKTARAEFESRKREGVVIAEEYRRLAGLYRDAALWFREQASAHPVTDHTDKWFVSHVMNDRALAHDTRASELSLRAEKASTPGDEARVDREYRRLASLFDVTIESFERKRYENLSHEPNKAMNLNSYLGLIGGRFTGREQNGILYLNPASPSECTLSVPDATYVITLDADSLLMPEYAPRLIEVMQRPGNERLAVVQTPYNAIPGAPGVLERVAGATTDIQYIIHQGFTSHDATYWVGANALLRKKALDDIMTMIDERGYQVPRYIHDRTVIEDTESSIDLVARGWKLYNYPERLSYSATPPDYGALLIQRRRWANGGLIILPKLLRHLFTGWGFVRKVGEGLMRFHYLTSITGVNIGLVVVLLYPFEDNLRNIWLPLSALPYYLFYGRDLVHSGYKMSDLLRVYALNLVLVPINLGGVFKSLHQGWTGQKIPFKRTPKIMGRTSAPALYIICETLIVLYCMCALVADSYNGRWLHAVFALLNGGLFLYGVVIFMGLRESREDVLHSWKTGRLRPAVSTVLARYERNGTVGTIVRSGIFLLATALLVLQAFAGTLH
ncbi:MAG: glycosyltransferase family 2 protein [Chloroflexota bacterium]